LPVFPDFQKTSKSTDPFGKTGPSQAVSDRPLNQSQRRKNPASILRPPKRAAKSGSPYISGKRQAGYGCPRILPIYQPVWLFIS